MPGYYTDESVRVGSIYGAINMYIRKSTSQYNTGGLVGGLVEYIYMHDVPKTTFIYFRGTPRASPATSFHLRDGLKGLRYIAVPVTARVLQGSP